MLQNCWKFQNRNVQTFGFVYHGTNGLNHGPVWKTQSFLLKGICTVILWQDCYGKGNLRKSYWSTVGRRFPVGYVSIGTPWKRVILIRVCGWHQIWWKETKNWSDVESTQERSWFRRTNIFPWSCVPGLHSKTMWNKQRCCGQLQSHVWVTNFRVWNWKIPYSENIRISSWSYDMEGHAKKCVERYCELANKTTQQLYKVSTPCIDDHHFKEDELKPVGELSKVCSQIVLKCLKIGAHWQTIHSMASIQTCTSSHQMDQSLWRTLRSFHFFHHTSEFKQYCHVGNTAQQYSLQLFQNSDFA